MFHESTPVVLVTLMSYVRARGRRILRPSPWLLPQTMSATVKGSLAGPPDAAETLI